MTSQELYGKWSTAVIVIYPYSFMETKILSTEKSITLFDGERTIDGENKVTEKQYPVRG